LPKKKPSPDLLVELLTQWRLWLLGAALGALLGWLAFQAAPPAYRAQATVVVDANLEEAWQYFPDRQLFQFLQRETERLEELAWSDEVMRSVAANQPAFTPQQLRLNILQLSHPSDGGWHLTALSADPAQAQALAADWAAAFVAAAQTAVQPAPELEAVRGELAEALARGAEADSAEVQELLQTLTRLNEQVKGISVYTQLYVSQAAGLPATRSVTQATYLLVGSIIGALSAPLYLVLKPAAMLHKR
jgi:uncharacterized protein involved in exopolysaccharide biosynthesis